MFRANRVLAVFLLILIQPLASFSVGLATNTGDNDAISPLCGH